MFCGMFVVNDCKWCLGVSLASFIHGSHLHFSVHIRAFSSSSIHSLHHCAFFFSVSQHGSALLCQYHSWHSSSFFCFPPLFCSDLSALFHLPHLNILTSFISFTFHKCLHSSFFPSLSCGLGVGDVHVIWQCSTA